MLPVENTALPKQPLLHSLGFPGRSLTEYEKLPGDEEEKKSVWWGHLNSWNPNQRWHSCQLHSGRFPSRKPGGALFPLSCSTAQQPSPATQPSNHHCKSWLLQVFFPDRFQDRVDLFKTRRHLGFHPIESCFIETESRWMVIQGWGL